MKNLPLAFSIKEVRRMRAILRKKLEKGMRYDFIGSDHYGNAGEKITGD